MGRDRDQGTNQLFRLDTKATCFICFKAVEEVGSGSSTNNGEGGASPGTYSLGNICRYLKLDMEMLQLLINHDEEDEAQKSGHDDPTPEKGIPPPPNLKASLCQACGVVVARFSELARKQELIQMEMGNCLGVVGGLLAEADKDVPLVGQFHQRMTSDINPRSFLCLRTVEELRRDMAMKSLETAKKYQPIIEIERLARGRLGNGSVGNPGSSETSMETATPPQHAISIHQPRRPNARKPFRPRIRKRRAPRNSEAPASSTSFLPPITNNEEQINGEIEDDLGIPNNMSLAVDQGTETATSIPAPAASPQLPQKPPPRSFICQQCGATFKFQETLQGHLKIVHGFVREQESLLQLHPPVLLGPFPTPTQRNDQIKCRICEEPFNSKEWLFRHVLDSHGGEEVETDMGSRMDQMTLMPPPADANADPQNNFPMPGRNYVSFDEFLSGLIGMEAPNNSAGQVGTPRYLESSGTDWNPGSVPGVDIRERRPMPPLIPADPMFLDGSTAMELASSSDTAPSAPPGRYRCSGCPVEFTHRTSYRRHFRAAHAEQVGIVPRVIFRCGICDKTFLHPSTLLRHSLSVHRGRRYKCMYCSKAFAYACTMYHHRKHKCLKRPSLLRVAIGNLPMPIPKYD